MLFELLNGHGRMKATIDAKYVERPAPALHGYHLGTTTVGDTVD